MTAALLLALSALAGLAVVFALLYGLARRIDNYGIVDIAWSYAFGALALFYALLGPGWAARRALIAGKARFTDPQFVAAFDFEARLAGYLPRSAATQWCCGLS